MFETAVARPLAGSREVSTRTRIERQRNLFDFLNLNDQFLTCYRQYYVLSVAARLLNVQAYGTANAFGGHIPFKVSMRAAPTASFSNVADIGVLTLGHLRLPPQAHRYLLQQRTIVR